jgi:transcriptional regulator with XRE-family HTH domain
MHEPSAVARTIESYRKAEGVSVRSAAKKAGLSEGRWRQIAKGYQQATKEVRVPVNAPTETLVRMALALHMSPYYFERVVDDSEEGRAASVFLTALKAAIPKPVGSPMFGGSYEDPEYLGNIEEWVSELQTRIEMLEDRLAKVEPDDSDTDLDIEDADPDYSNMSDQDAKDYGLAAHKGDDNIGFDDIPHEP